MNLSEVTAPPTRVMRWVIQFTKIGAEPELVQDSPDQWTLTIGPDKLPEESAFGITFKRKPNGRMKVDIELVLEGKRENPRDVIEAFGLLAKSLGSMDKPSVTEEKQASRTNSVEVRKATVIRN